MTVVSGPSAGVGSPETPAGRDVLSLPAEVKASIRILIVDDERTLRESCALVLRDEGYTVTLAGRGEEALDLVRRRQFDQVLIGRASHAILKGREAADLRLQVMRQHSHSDSSALIGISPAFRKAVELA